MKYHSRSPEEWKKYDEERKKELEQKYFATHKKVRRTFWSMYFFFALLTIAFLFYSKSFKERVNLPHSKILNGVNFYIDMPDLFKFPEALKMKVNMVNTSKNTIPVTINSFFITIKKLDSEENIYTFSYSNLIKTDLKSFEGKVIFDLSTIKEISKLKNGKYQVKVTLNVWGKPLILEKNFEYQQTMIINLIPFEDFFLENEAPKLKMIIQNLSDESKNLILNGKIVVKNKSFKSEYEKNFGVMNLKPLETKMFDVFLNSLNSGYYDVIFESPNITVVTGLNIVKSVDRDPSGLSIKIYAPKYVVVGQNLSGNIAILNSKKKERPIEIEEYFISLRDPSGNEIYRYKNPKKFRLFVPAEGARSFLNLPSHVTFSKSGNYELYIEIYINGRKLNKKFYIKSGG